MKRTSDHVRISERLDLLRELDTTRSWDSLDHERICLLCERQFAGRQVDFTQLNTGVQVSCPTEGCKATPHEWVYLDDPRIAARQGKRQMPFFGRPATA